MTKTPFKMKGFSGFGEGTGSPMTKPSPAKILPLIAWAAKAVGGKVLSSVLGHKSKQDQEKLAASRTAAESTPNIDTKSNKMESIQTKEFDPDELA